MSLFDKAAEIIGLRRKPIEQRLQGAKEEYGSRPQAMDVLERATAAMKQKAADAGVQQPEQPKAHPVEQKQPVGATPGTSK